MLQPSEFEVLQTLAEVSCHKNSISNQNYDRIVELLTVVVWGVFLIKYFGKKRQKTEFCLEFETLWQLTLTFI